jgi:ABC-2 type transport system ATP-binding protein
LDVQSAHQLRDQIRRLNGEGVTIFLTTHYLEEADQLCDVIALINGGRIVALDSPENLKASVTGDRVVEVSFSAPVPEAELEALQASLRFTGSATSTGSACRRRRLHLDR